MTSARDTRDGIEEDLILLDTGNESDNVGEVESDVEIDFTTKPKRTDNSLGSSSSKGALKLIPKKSSKIYDNISVYAPPDSTLIFRCSQKRADWYLSRSLARQISPSSIELTFVPAGKGRADDAYYLEERENRCVICGVDSESVGATMLHIVPDQYRRWFPLRVKSRSSYDIVVACPECNSKWDKEAAVVRKSIVDAFSVPLEGLGWVRDKEAGAARRAASAIISERKRQWTLLHSDSTGEQSVKAEATTRPDDSEATGAKKVSKIKKKTGVIPLERLRQLETIVIDWWRTSHPAQVSPELNDDKGAVNEGRVGQMNEKQEHEADQPSVQHPSAALRQKRGRALEENATYMPGNEREGPEKKARLVETRSPLQSVDMDIPPPLPEQPTELTELMLRQALESEQLYKAKDYQEHGQLVVTRVMALSSGYHQDKGEAVETLAAWKTAQPGKSRPPGWRTLDEFVQTWRQEFLVRMQPRNLSDEWRAENPINSQ